MAEVDPDVAGEPGHDPGLAGPRTELAWSRTAISFAALGAAVLHRAPLAGAVVIALGAAVWMIGRLPGRRRSAGAGARERRLRLVTIATVAVALTALGLTLLA